MDELASQGRFYVNRDLSGRVRIECPPIMLVPREIAVQMATAILQMAGAEVIFSDLGQTVIRGNGNGKVLR